MFPLRWFTLGVIQTSFLLLAQVRDIVIKGDPLVVGGHSSGSGRLGSSRIMAAFLCGPNWGVTILA